jgi:hypothetical protein
MPNIVQENLEKYHYVVVQSVCCSAKMSDEDQDNKVCPDCGEDCELDGFWIRKEFA